MFAKWLGADSPAADPGRRDGRDPAAARGVVIAGRGSCRVPDTLEGALLLLLIPLLSPQGWDYVFLIGTPAVAMLLINDCRLPRGCAAAIGPRSRRRALSIFDLMGANGLLHFHGLSLITVCFVVSTALVALRFRRHDGRCITPLAVFPRDGAAGCHRCAAVTLKRASSLADPEAGISEDAGRERAARISNLRYDLTFTIPATAPTAGRRPRGDPFSFHLGCGASAGARLRRLRKARWRASRPTERTRGRAGQRPRHRPRRDAARRREQPGARVPRADAPLNRNDEFLYTMFVPARAHQAFPCFDQPDLKARWSLALDVPAGWQALGNGAELEREQPPDGRAPRSPRRSRSRPTSSPSPRASSGRDRRSGTAGRSGCSIARPTRPRSRATATRSSICTPRRSTGSRRTPGIPYPFGKFDFLLVPAFQFGGMEHPGAIFYNAKGLLLDESATQDQMLGRASVIAHETAHMWFGDLVTMRWFNDVWMKEVFANHMAAKIVNPAFPAINHDLRFSLAHYPVGLRRRPHRRHQRDPPAARQPQRGGQPLRRDHLPEGADRHAPARDAARRRRVPRRPARVPEGARVRQRHLAGPDRACSTPARPRTWRPGAARGSKSAGGRPITTELRSPADGSTALAFTQRDPLPARGLIWNQRIKVARRRTPRDSRRGSTGPVERPRTRRSAGGARAAGAAFVLPNGGGVAYGEFRPRRRQPARGCCETCRDRRRADARRARWVTLWDAMLDGRRSAGGVPASSRCARCRSRRTS